MAKTRRRFPIEFRWGGSGAHKDAPINLPMPSVARPGDLLLVTTVGRVTAVPEGWERYEQTVDDRTSTVLCRFLDGSEKETEIPVEGPGGHVVYNAAMYGGVALPEGFKPRDRGLARMRRWWDEWRGDRPKLRP